MICTESYSIVFRSMQVCDAQPVMDIGTRHTGRVLGNCQIAQGLVARANSLYDVRWMEVNKIDGCVDYIGSVSGLLLENSQAAAVFCVDI